jgi:hypothetical protein
VKHLSIRVLTLALLAGLLPACGGGGDSTTNVFQGDLPAPSGSIVVLGQDNALFFVYPNNPTVVLDSKLIWGVQAGTTIIAISFRPATGQLFARGDDNRLYVISTATGFADLVSGFVTGGTGSFFGMDFSPTSDRIRIVTEGESNFRLNPSDSFSTIDTNLNPAGNVVAVSYTNSFAGAVSTTLYGIDSTSSSLVMIGGLDGSPSPNSGAVTTVGPVGVTVFTNTGTPFFGLGFDISPGGIAYAAMPFLDTNGIASTGLYTINLTTGAATLVGPLVGGGPIRAISVAP